MYSTCNFLHFPCSLSLSKIALDMDMLSFRHIANLSKMYHTSETDGKDTDWVWVKSHSLSFHGDSLDEFKWSEGMITWKQE
jgi:hypothetical protein